MEELIASNPQRMKVDLTSVERTGRANEHGYEMVGIIALEYRVPPTAQAERITVVGANGAVRSSAEVVALTRPAQLSVTPDMLYWNPEDNSRIGWIEHTIDCSPCVLSKSEEFDVVLGKTKVKSSFRAVTQVKLSRRPNNETRLSDQGGHTATNTAAVEFGCDEWRATLRIEFE